MSDLTAEPPASGPLGPEPLGPESLDRRKGGDRRREIAEAALRCLERVGYAEVTARKVAAEAGISLGHISYHYAGMDEVLAAACQLAAERLQAAGEARIALPGATPAERLEAFLKAGFTEDVLTPGRLRARIDLWSAAISHPAIAEVERGLYLKGIPAQLAELLGYTILPAIAALEGDGVPKAEVQRLLSRAETDAQRLIDACEALRLHLKGGIKQE